MYMNFLVVIQKLVVLFKIEAVHIQKSHSLSKHHQLEYQCYTSGGYHYCFFLDKNECQLLLRQPLKTVNMNKPLSVYTVYTNKPL